MQSGAKIVLAASNLAWVFDGFEFYGLFLTVGFALHQLLPVTEYKAVPAYTGYVLATTVFGWATGGSIGGIIADYIGRKRTMMLMINDTNATGLRCRQRPVGSRPVPNSMWRYR